ncbi:MAG: T9SS type A sorting domain-containing protein [Phaeodactylibacter sp.]|uniref:T9SS type A sorting domain-containing protein n=1 Tax=Phaeodactylibacter sp. TaxID=1940289 RepID=UPI0032EE653A
MKSIVPALIGVCLSFSLYATHLIGGEIAFRQIDPLTVEAEGYLYHSSGGRDSITLCWGDGNCDRVVRSNGPDIDGDGIPDGEPVPGTSATLSIYKHTHTYEAKGAYILSITEPNRNGGILNLNFPNSDQVRFHVQSLVNVTNDNTPNHSPVNYEPMAVDNAMESRLFQHTPNAFDQDGDSIAYHLVAPNQDIDTELPNYEDQLAAVSLDPITGVFNFQSDQPGEYVFAIQVRTYRNDTLQDVVVRDMLIFCSPGALLPPILSLSQLATEREVLVGDTVIIDAAALSEPFGEPLQLTCTGGLLEYFGNPATFDSLPAAPLAEATFQWVVEPEDFRDAPYQIVFKARDDGNIFGLSTLIPVRFRVVEALTSTDVFNGRTDWKLFPNPATGSLQISRSEYSGPVGYEIRAASGQLLLSGRLQQSGNRVDISSLPKGWYVLSVLLPDGQQRPLPFIKQ